jgi:hypothetical protein
MAAGFDRAGFQRAIRDAQRKGQAEVDRVNRENKRRVDAFNREVARVNAHNKKVERWHGRPGRWSSRRCTAWTWTPSLNRRTTPSRRRYAVDMSRLGVCCANRSRLSLMPRATMSASPRRAPQIAPRVRVDGMRSSWVDSSASPLRHCLLRRQTDGDRCVARDAVQAHRPAVSGDDGVDQG